MTVNFHKYQGTGNDFIMIDNRAGGLIDREQTELVEYLCDRRFGIGGDGLILLQDRAGVDFEMVYFNSDGRESTMCGNGGRCLVKFAHHLGIIGNKCSFMAIDGPHEAEILANGDVKLKMKHVDDIENYHSDYVLNTGSPHYVSFVNDVEGMNIVELAKNIRYSERFETEGINVNFAEKKSSDELYVRTYERGVEDETLSCGTGVVASAIAFASKQGLNINEVNIETPGGKLKVQFNNMGKRFMDVYLIGPAEKVFEGSVEL